jgi:predicted dinucleotide-binding enzyme
MHIGILGAGNVGGALGRLWAAQGHAIMFGVRDPHSPKTQAALVEGLAKLWIHLARNMTGREIAFKLLRR